MEFALENYKEILKKENKSAFMKYILIYLAFILSIGLLFISIVMTIPGLIVIYTPINGAYYILMIFSFILTVFLSLIATGIAYSALQKGFGKSFITKPLRLLKKGAGMLILGFVYGILIAIPLIIIGIIISLLSFISPVLFAILTILFIIAAIIYIVFAIFLVWGAQAEYAQTGKLKKAFSFKTVYKKAIRKKFILTTGFNLVFVILASMALTAILNILISSLSFFLPFNSESLEASLSVFLISAIVYVFAYMLVQLMLSIGLGITIAKAYSKK